jgi:hypothetical protein
MIWFFERADDRSSSTRLSECDEGFELAITHAGDDRESIERFDDAAFGRGEEVPPAHGVRLGCAGDPRN